MNARRILSVVTYAILACWASADTGPFTISTTEGTLDITCNEVSTDFWDLEITVNLSSVDADLLILVDEEVSIDNLVLQIDAPSIQRKVNITIRGPVNNEDNLQDLNNITVGSSNDADIILKLLRTSGSVGYLETHGATNILIGGDVTDEFKLLESPSTNFAADIVSELIVLGDFLGDFTNDGQWCNILKIQVQGDIGTSSSPASFSMNHNGGASNFGTIVCDNAYIDLFATGALRRFETQGVLVGDIDCRAIKIFNTGVGQGDPGIFIGSGNLSGLIRTTTNLTTNFDADIYVPGTVTTSAEISIVQLASGNTVYIGGDLDGELYIGPNDGTIDIAGGVNALIQIGSSSVSADFDGTISIGDDLDKDQIIIYGDVGSTAEISIGGELQSLILITGEFNGLLDISSTAGLLGQIIINANNSSSEWLGDVTIDTTVLGPNESQPYLGPYYNSLSSVLGGGAIGLVPFNMHSMDCLPADGAILDGTHDIDEARIRHYGPITLDQSGGLAIKLERRSTYFPGSWTDISSELSTSDVTVSGRDLLVEYDFDCAREYRITPITGRIKCDIPSPVNVDSWTYNFKIIACIQP